MKINSLFFLLWLSFELGFPDFLVDFLQKAVRYKRVPITFVELVLELDPVQTQSVKETLHDVHAHEHTESRSCEHWEEDDHLELSKKVPR